MGKTTVATNLQKKRIWIDANGNKVSAPGRKTSKPNETPEEKRARLLKELAELENDE